ncbi:hypothetical protein JCM3774_003764 [Rhodotorula dairenensis]
MSDIEYLRSQLGVHPDFPKKGIVFLDIFPLLRDPIAFETLITHFLHHLTSTTLPRLRAETGNPHAKIDAFVGLDARGFLFGPVLASRLGAAFVAVRKQGKLPGQCFKAEYEKEYGTDVFEMQEDALPAGANVVVIDDLIATGGSAFAAHQLVDQAKAKVIQNLFVVDIEFLKGADKLPAPSYSIIKAD